jgi:hypothetical protein
MRLSAANVRKNMMSKRERATSAPPVKRKRERANDYMRGSPSAGEGLRVQDMSEIKNCECAIENEVLTICTEHTQELANLLANPPTWAIKAREGKI